MYIQYSRTVSSIMRGFRVLQHSLTLRRGRHHHVFGFVFAGISQTQHSTMSGRQPTEATFGTFMRLFILLGFLPLFSESFLSGRHGVRHQAAQKFQPSAISRGSATHASKGGVLCASTISPESSSSSRTQIVDIRDGSRDKLLLGRWTERSGNFMLLPLDGNGVAMEQPLGVIHFLGGAFVGAAPHITYRYLLEALNSAGYIIVATPYRLDMDYLRSCDVILAKFDAIAVDLAAKYGPIPVIGLGHSCGALLQTLITCLFPNAPRAINILISFNNKPVSAAIPGFEEFVVPLSEQIMGDGRAGVRIRETVENARTAFDSAVDVFAQSPLAPGFFGSQVVPFFRQLVETADQVPPLLDIIAKGQREFEPTPADTKEVCKRMYRARRTLLLKFENDALDESSEIEKVLKEANTIMRMKRPMVEMEVDLRVMTGTHITPLTQNIVLDSPKNVPLLQPLLDINDALTSSAREQVKINFLKTVNEVKSEILDFLNSSMAKNE